MQTPIAVATDAVLKMKERLQVALSNQDIHRLVLADFTYTLKFLGLEERIAGQIAGDILSRLKQDEDLLAAEAAIGKYLGDYTHNTKSLLELIEQQLSGRAEKIYGQVAPFFRAQDLAVDFGCGDGQVTGLLQDRIGLGIHGYDVVAYRSPKSNVSVKLFDGKRTPAADGFYDIGLMTNVAHHEENNELILDELARIIKPGGRLVVIETVPQFDSIIETERTFVNDYVYNRLFHPGANIAVPGTYETVIGWVERFEAKSFQLERFADHVNPKVLGFDQPMIRDWHVRYVFVKK